MTRKPLSGAELNELVAGLNKLAHNLVVDVEPGGAGFVPGTVAARLAKPVSQRRGHFARGVGLRAARAFAGGGLPGARPRRAAAVSRRISTKKTPGAARTRRSCTKIRSPISPPSSASTNRCRFRRAAWASCRATTRNPPATSASASSASACFTARAISSRRLTRTTGRRSFTI